ncbi:hypothetical protein K439DRAFT_1663094 [Ramaria rubella]|nr:hypothetical protein K439DRAFT_1663094 [Ramaria rubella]
MALFLPFLSLLLHLFALNFIYQCSRSSFCKASRQLTTQVPPCHQRRNTVCQPQAETATSAQAHLTEYLQFDCCPHNEDRQWNCVVSAIIHHEDVGYGVTDNVRSKGDALDKCKKEAVTLCHEMATTFLETPPPITIDAFAPLTTPSSASPSFPRSQSDDKLRHCWSLIMQKPAAPAHSTLVISVSLTPAFNSDNFRREPQRTIPLWPHWQQPHVAAPCDHTQLNEVLQQWQHRQTAPKCLIVDPMCSWPDDDLYDTDDDGPM